MARTIETIKQQITTELMSYPVIRAAYKIGISVPNDAFDSVFSKASIENIFFYVVAFAFHIQERIFDTEKEKLIAYAESLRPHTKQWYIATLKAFQLGHAVNEDGKYDIIDESAQIIKHCSLRKDDVGNISFLIADDAGGVPIIISSETIKEQIKQYAERVFDAGVHFEIYSNDADVYQCEILINYDPLVLDALGKRLDGTNDTPVIDAINGYFRSFPFDSEFSNMALTDSIQLVEGVRVVQITASKARPSFGGFINVESTYIAASGYMMFDELASNIIYTI
jgi:hypothetical protein